MKGAVEEKLDSLLDAIDPSRTLDEGEHRADTALGSYALDVGAIQDWREYVGCLARFFGHLERHLLNLPGPYPGNATECWGQCSRVLDQIYGRNGDMAAYQIVRTGAERGLYGVLKEVARSQARAYTEREILAQVVAFWKALSAKEQFEAVDIYLAEYGHYYPDEFQAGGFSTLKIHFWKVLVEHPHMLQRLRKVTR